MGSPRPFFTLTEQWGLLGALVGLVRKPQRAELVAAAGSAGRGGFSGGWVRGEEVSGAAKRSRRYPARKEGVLSVLEFRSLWQDFPALRYIETSLLHRLHCKVSPH